MTRAMYHIAVVLAMVIYFSQEYFMECAPLDSERSEDAEMSDQDLLRVVHKMIKRSTLFNKRRHVQKRQAFQPWWFFCESCDMGDRWLTMMGPPGSEGGCLPDTDEDVQYVD